jgi:hypothetical protein
MEVIVAKMQHRLSKQQLLRAKALVVITSTWTRFHTALCSRCNIRVLDDR